jgi:ribonuclease J
VFVSLAVNSKLEVAGGIQLLTDGIPAGFDDDLLNAAEQAFASTPKPRRKDDEQVAEPIRTAIRRAADAAWGKKPITKVMVLRV